MKLEYLPADIINHILGFEGYNKSTPGLLLTSLYFNNITEFVQYSCTYNLERTFLRLVCTCNIEFKFNSKIHKIILDYNHEPFIKIRKENIIVSINNDIKSIMFMESLPYYNQRNANETKIRIMEYLIEKTEPYIYQFYLKKFVNCKRRCHFCKEYELANIKKCELCNDYYCLQCMNRKNNHTCKFFTSLF
jgi:hypothetical protein